MASEGALGSRSSSSRSSGMTERVTGLSTGGSRPVTKPSAKPSAMLANPVAITIDPALPSLRSDGTKVSGALPASSISRRASPMSRRRLPRFFCRHRRSRRWTAVGVLSGKLSQPGSRSMILARVSVTVSATKGVLPVSASNKQQPKAQMSVRLSTSVPRVCSGIM